MAIVLAVGCGGRTSSPDADAGTGGATGNANGAGGASATGTGGVVTTGSGTTVGGTTTGTGGSGAKGGTGGSGGAGGTIDFGACTGPGQCELAPVKCCLCGILGLEVLEAINSANRTAYLQQTCGLNPPPCPNCAATIEPHLMARCESGRCTKVDMSKDPTYTKCGSDQECMLRKGLACCECGATGDWVAIGRVGNKLLISEVCPQMSACPDCAPTPPAGVSAVCRNGACVTTP
ncbi:MAG TPA: hypothetical protein VK550_18470 [Polyangiaceae bacterium]|nr:hypothetical protein [Polyangiaceae bacterium]